jgi:hypothetical protein
MLQCSRTSLCGRCLKGRSFVVLKLSRVKA